MPPSKKSGCAARPPAKPYTQQYGVIVLCDTEKHQEKIYNKLRKEGHKCKVVTT